LDGRPAYCGAADCRTADARHRRAVISFLSGEGDRVLVVLDRIRRDAPPGAWVTLLADPPGRRLYARHGFADTAPDSIGMALRTAPTEGTP